MKDKNSYCFFRWELTKIPYTQNHDRYFVNFNQFCILHKFLFSANLIYRDLLQNEKQMQSFLTVF